MESDVNCLIRNKVNAFFVILSTFSLTTCRPNPPVDFRRAGWEDIELNKMVEERFGIVLPSAAVAIEALSHGGRKPDGWYLFSCDSAAATAIENSAKERLGKVAAWTRSGHWSDFVSENDVPPSILRYLKSAGVSSQKSIVYSYRSGTSSFRHGILLVFVPERAWVMLHFRR